MEITPKKKSLFENIFKRIVKRDSSENESIAIKNSAYQFSTNFTGRLGSMIFVIILARIILPETFGLYSLALSTIMFFYVFSDFGAGQALVYFLSKTLHKEDEKAKAYINYLLKIKLLLILASATTLIVLSQFISNSYYQKPIFLALIAGSIYLVFTSLQSFYIALAQSNNDFKTPLIKEIFLQLSKIIIIPLVILYLKNKELGSSLNVLAIIISLSVISLFCMLIIHYFSTKNLKLAEIKPGKLSREDKSEVRSFLLKTSLVTSSILLMGNIDKIIIGPFVPSEFIGYYSAAFSLVNASAILIVLSDVFFPLFLRMKGNQLRNAFKKSIRAVLILSLLLFAFLFIFASPLIRIIFGANYLQSINMLRMLALLAIFLPLIEFYTSYIISKGNLGKIMKVVIFIVVLSLILPFVLVRLLINYGYTAAILGLILGLLVSKAVHLICLIWISRKPKPKS